MTHSLVIIYMTLKIQKIVFGSGFSDFQDEKIRQRKG